MANHRSIIPEFMAQNPNDTFKLLLPLKLVLGEDKFRNSHFDVLIKNMSKNELFSYKLSPELLFTHFPIEKLEKHRPPTLFNASLISGITPAALDIIHLNLNLKQI